MTQSGGPERSARDMGRTVREQGQEVAGTARDSAGEVIQDATARGKDLYEQLKQRAAGEAEGQVQRLATNLRYLADDLRHMSEGAKPDSPAAAMVHEAADRGRLLADRLDRQGPGDLIDEVREFARRRPGLFLAGAALAGVAVARLGRGVGTAGSRRESAGGDREPPPSLPPAEPEHVSDTALPPAREMPPEAGVLPAPDPPPAPGAVPQTYPGTQPPPRTAQGWQE